MKEQHPADEGRSFSLSISERDEPWQEGYREAFDVIRDMQIRQTTVSEMLHDYPKAKQPRGKRRQALQEELNRLYLAEVTMLERMEIPPESDWARWRTSFRQWWEEQGNV